MIRFGNNRGIALLLVLWVLMILSVIVFEFCRFMRTEVKITQNYKELTTSHYAAFAGFHRGIFELLNIVNETEKTDQVEEDEEGEEEWRLNAESALITIGDGAFRVIIQNEQGKININTADERELMLILASSDLDESTKTAIVNSILDWRDNDSFIRIDGAEDRYYQSLDPPYDCGNKDFTSVEQLLLVKGISEDIFFNVLEPNATVREQSEEGKININSASKSMLQSLPGMTEELADEVLLYRETENFEDLSVFKEIVGAETFKALKPYVTLKNSSFYTIVSSGTVNTSDIEKSIQGVVEIDGKYDKGYKIVEFTCGRRI